MPSLVHYAIPFFVLLLLAEAVFSARGHRGWFQTRDTAASLAMGIGNVIVGLVVKGIVFSVLLALWQVRLLEMPPVWWSFVLLFLADDFSYYWMHRASHGTRWFWASHVVHHSSRRYNLGTALRQTWTGTLTGSFVFWLWMPLVGFHPVWIMTAQSANLIYQFWIHTEAVDRLPAPFEWIFNTPSHHRVHHGSDLKYLDLNLGGVLIVWDRIFGTFQSEEEHPTYGLTKNIDTFNPFRIAFHEWADLVRDVIKASSWSDRILYVFGPPGWSPDRSTLTTRQLRAGERPVPRA